jgi:acyl carrier protein
MTEVSTPTVEGRSEDEIRATVVAIVMELAPGDQQPADPSAQLVDDLGYHSLALLELAFTLEDEFDLPPIDETTARKITSVEAVAEHVVTAMRERGALVG